MKRTILVLICLMTTCCLNAQHQFSGSSLSEALITLDSSTKRYDISFVYDELEDFTVTKKIRKGCPIPEAVRQVCGFYPVKVSVKGHHIFVECIQKDRTKFTGRIIGPDGQPVAYANITLFSLSDSTYIGGGVSNEAGDFVIPCGAECAKVRISYVGYKTLERLLPIGNVGTINMQIANNRLSTISIHGQMSVIRNETGRLQYIVRNDEFAKGLNVLELLYRVPMVSMVGGKAVILGKGIARFMLNGHIADMGEDLILQKLWTLRSEDIERIEVVSIPSGRNMTDMGGGYINIVTRRDQPLGWRGGVTSEVIASDNWSSRASGSVSYASEKVDIMIDASMEHITQTTESNTLYNISNNEEMISDIRDRRKDNGITASLSLRFIPSDNLELGGMFSFYSQEPENKIDGKVTYKKGISESESEFIPNDNTTTKSVSAYCDWRLDSKGKQLRLSYNNYRKDDDAKSGVWYTNTFDEVPSIKRTKLFLSKVDYHIQSGRLDLMVPFEIATIDAGTSYTYICNHAEQSEGGDNSTEFFKNIILDYIEKKKAAYISVYHEGDNYSANVGLRYEYNSQGYWLPTLGLSYKPLDGHQFNLTYGANCVLPNFYAINPLQTYKTAYNISKGNPELRPSRTSNVELSYRCHNGIYACVFHHHTSNVVQWMPIIENAYLPDKTATISASIVRSPNNDGRVNKTGIYLRYQRQLNPNLLATVEGESYYHDFKMAKSSLEIESPFSLYGWCNRAAVSADWYLNRQHNLLLNTSYHHWISDYDGITKTGGYGYFNLALHYSIMDERLKFSLVVNDPFAQHITNDVIPVLMHCHTNHHDRYIGLTATYSLGDKKVKRIHQNAIDIESQRAQRVDE